MKNAKKLINSPGKIYGISFIAFFLFCLIGIPIINMGHSDGEQIPLVMLVYAGYVMIILLFILSILTSFMFRGWFKKYWFINLIIMVFTGYVLISYLYVLISYLIDRSF